MLHPLSVLATHIKLHAVWIPGHKLMCIYCISLTWFSPKCSFWYIKNSLWGDWCKQNCNYFSTAREISHNSVLNPKFKYMHLWVVHICAPYHHFLYNTLSSQTVKQIITKTMWMMQNWYDIWHQLFYRNVKEIHRGLHILYLVAP
jgi:hypothetical protein